VLATSLQAISSKQKSRRSTATLLEWTIRGSEPPVSAAPANQLCKSSQAGVISASISSREASASGWSPSLARTAAPSWPCESVTGADVVAAAVRPKRNWTVALLHSREKARASRCVPSPARAGALSWLPAAQSRFLQSGTAGSKRPGFVMWRAQSWRDVKQRWIAARTGAFARRAVSLTPTQRGLTPGVGSIKPWVLRRRHVKNKFSWWGAGGGKLSRRACRSGPGWVASPSGGLAMDRRDSGRWLIGVCRGGGGLS
jgi:hypothetical protein